MTREVKHIIENKRFRPTWDDFLCYWEFIVPLAFFLFAFDLIANAGDVMRFVRGSILLIGGLLLTKFLLHRNKQLNKFEEITNNRTQQENFDIVMQGLKTIRVVEIDRDKSNWTINARYKSSGIPPVSEWLTIVCLDNCVLVNSRPVPLTMLLWIRRNAMIDFKRLV